MTDDLRPSWSTFREVATGIYNAAMKPLWDAYESYDPGAPWHKLTAGQRALYALWLVESEQPAEGFHGTLWNLSGFHVQVAARGSKSIGASGFTEVLESVISIFPLGEVPTATADRRHLLEESGEEGNRILERADHEFWRLLDGTPTLVEYCVRYIVTNPSQFWLF